MIGLPHWQRPRSLADAMVRHVMDEPAEVYHRRAGEFLSSHRLAAFRECPRLYQYMQQGIIEEQDRPAFALGRAAHTLILEGREAFESRYAVGGPINPKTGQPFGSSTKAWAEWAQVVGKPVITDDQAVLVERMYQAVRGHGLATDLLSHGRPEGVVRCEYHSVQSQIRMDWLNPVRGLVDLKTSDNLAWFESDARRYQYVHQLAFYRAVLASATGQTVDVHLVAVEKREPFRCGVWRVGQDVLASAQQANEEAIDRLNRCRAVDVWPTGFEDMRVLDYL